MRKNIDCFVSITIYNTVKFMFLKTLIILNIYTLKLYKKLLIFVVKHYILHIKKPRTDGHSILKLFSTIQVWNHIPVIQSKICLHIQSILLLINIIHINMNSLSIKLYRRENQWCICKQPNNDVFFCKSYIKVFHIVYDNGRRAPCVDLCRLKFHRYSKWSESKT